MNRDYEVLQKLGHKIAEIAYLPVQEEKKKLWTANNDLKPIRPMVYMDQLPWHELGTSEEMKLECEDPYLQSVELELKRLLYRWNHFPADMVVEKWISLKREIHNLDYGMHIIEDVRKTDENNDVVSHHYVDQISTYEKLEALSYDHIWVDEELDKRHMEQCQEIFDGILPVKFAGVEIHSGVWDRIAQMRSVTNVLWDIVDRPEFIIDVVKKMVDITMDTVDQCEELGLLDPDMQYIHCTGAYTNDLPKDGLESGKATSKNVWTLGMAQMLSTVSPAMTEEFEIDLVKPLLDRFGLVYYGCCEAMDDKIDIVRKLKNVRKISVSPWADPVKCAEKMSGDYVMSFKSNPALIAVGTFNEEQIRKGIETALRAAKENHTPVEIILKDVSTVSYKLGFLDRWEKLAMEMVQNWG